MVVITVVFIAHAKGLMPCQTRLFPVVKPLHFGAGLAEKLHLHLLKLAHTEYKLAGHNFVTEGLSNLCDTERQLLTRCLLHVQEVHKDALGGFRTQVNPVRCSGLRTEFGRKHEVKLPYIGPVFGAADGVYYLFIHNNLLQFVEVGPLHGSGITLMKGVALGLMFEHARVGFAEFSLIKAVAKALGGLAYLLGYLLFVLGNLIFYEHIGAVSLLRVAVIYQRIVESIDVARGLPHRGVHENSGINAHDIVVQQNHRVPPVLFNIVFKLHAVGAVVVDCRQSVRVNIRTWEHETVFLTVTYNLLETVFCHVSYLVF